MRRHVSYRALSACLLGAFLRETDNQNRRLPGQRSVTKTTKHHDVRSLKLETTRFFVHDAHTYSYYCNMSLWIPLLIGLPTFIALLLFVGVVILKLFLFHLAVLIISRLPVLRDFITIEGPTRGRLWPLF